MGTLINAPAKRVAVTLQSIHSGRPDVPRELRDGLHRLGLIERKSAADYNALKTKAARINEIDNQLSKTYSTRRTLTTKIEQLRATTKSPVKQRTFRKGLQQREETARTQQLADLRAAETELETLNATEGRLQTELTEAYDADSAIRNYTQVGDEYLATTAKGSAFAGELEVVTHETKDLTLGQAHRLYKQLVRSGELEDKRSSLRRARAEEHPVYRSPTSASTGRSTSRETRHTSYGSSSVHSTEREPTFLEDMLTTDPSRFFTPGGMLSPFNPASPNSIYD